MLELAENNVARGEPATFYACRKATDEGMIPRGTPMVFDGCIPPGWELMRADDPWLQTASG